MKATEFCYWLQGSFELNDTKAFDVKESQNIKQHLDLVFKHDPKANSFCFLLKGIFITKENLALDETTTQNIKEQLAATFKNEIDPSYPKNEQDELNQLHNNGIKKQQPLRC